MDAFIRHGAMCRRLEEMQHGEKERRPEDRSTITEGTAQDAEHGSAEKELLDDADGGPKVGLDIGAFIGVGTDHPRAIPKLEAKLARMPEVLECHHVTGRHTLLLKVRTTNTEALAALIGRLRELPGVARTETMVVLATQLERPQVLVPGPRASAKKGAAK